MPKDPYLLLIIVGVLIALSYVFNYASKKLRVPSVLFLIGTGIAINQAGQYMGIDFGAEVIGSLEILGIIGLIMIVLEAALDLKINRSKMPLIGKSLWMAFIILLASSFTVAFMISRYIGASFYDSLVNAVPLCVVSSSVMIPSVHNLTQEKKEFLIYESTFSDIIGIMFFNFIVMSEGRTVLTLDGFILIFATILGSVLFSYLMVYIFSKISAEVKFFLVIAMLLIFYSLGKLFHLSTLLIILIFGIILNNSGTFFRGPLSRMVNKSRLAKLTRDFRLITSESAFIVRTFFFVIFGMTININILSDTKVIVIGSLIVGIIYIVRLINFGIFARTSVIPEIFLSPRGLITILLFYSIPADQQIKEFGTGILFFLIITTGIIMMLALIFSPVARSSKDFTTIDIGFNTTVENIIANPAEKIDPIGPACDIDGKEGSEKIWD